MPIHVMIISLSFTKTMFSPFAWTRLRVQQMKHVKSRVAEVYVNCYM